MIMEAVDSSLIQERGYDPAQQVMRIRFKDKRFTHGAVYEYGNITQEHYANGCSWRNDNVNSEAFGDLSFGQWFQRHIKGNAAYPYRQVEAPSTVAEQTALPLNDALKASVGYGEERMDFTASGQVLPAEDPLPDDIEELGARALALQDRARAIVINSPEAYSIAETVGVAIVRMRDALEKTLRPKIEEARKPYKALLDILNKYDGPLESDQKRLTAGMSVFKRAEDQRILEASRMERARLQKIEDDKARAKAEELRRADAQAVREAGDLRAAKAIEKAPAPIVPAAYVPPVQITSSVPQSTGSYHVPKWEFEWVNEHGEVIEHPDMSLIPDMYKIVNERAIATAVRDSKNRTAIRGVRAYDAGAVRLKKK
jgi:hypothetical protein